MSLTPDPPLTFPEPRRRRSFTLLRLGPLAPVLGIAAGGLVICGADAPRAGVTVIAASVAVLVAWPYIVLYRMVVDRTRGRPEPQPCAGPRLLVEQAAWLMEAADGPGGLDDLGFEPGGWFFLDDSDQGYVWAWPHPAEPTVAYILYLSAATTFRFRFVTRLPGGGALVSTTRLTDISYAPPPGIYRQMRRARRPADLYGWHREAQRFLLGDAPPDLPRPDPVGLYMELLERLAWHIRLKRFWLLRFGPVRELWRLSRLAGVSVSEQVEEGWAPPPPWASTPPAG